MPSKRKRSSATEPSRQSEELTISTTLKHSPKAGQNGVLLSTSISNGAGKSANAKKLKKEIERNDDDSPLSELESLAEAPTKKAKRTPTKSSIAAKKGSDEIKAFKAEQAAKKAAEVKTKTEKDDETMDRGDPEGNEDAPMEDLDAIKLEAARPPPVNSEYLPLPWKGRLGYACLNTYLRYSNPPIFSSRTCRIASIIEHRHPLKDPSQPEHATKNRPDREQPADVRRGQRYIEELGLANARDISKMLRWNEKYGIRFLRLSSEMFPFASHEEYGYKLAPFASEALEEAGKIATELGHRLSTHPGQFTQLGSPRPEVIRNAIRDLEYHDEMLCLLKLPPQENRDAIMVLHLGGTFGDKAATMDRFRENYKKLSQSVKNRLVLENDDVSWTVHDLLPLCEELNIPLVLDFHHHNIIFDSRYVREGTQDIMSLFPRIKATWDRKEIRQKMHYSEPTPEAITGRQRRKHNARPATLPPCSNDMDLMIEAKDKEQAVFELMRNFKLPGWDTFHNIIPHERADDNKPAPKRAKKKKSKKQIMDEIEEFGKELSNEEDDVKVEIPEAEIGMGGPEARVYWPPGMEEWLRPKKREVKKKELDLSVPRPHNFAARHQAAQRAEVMLSEEMKVRLTMAATLADVQSVLEEIKAENAVGEEDEDGKGTTEWKKATTTVATAGVAGAKPSLAKAARASPTARKKRAKNVLTPSMSYGTNVNEEDDGDDGDDDEDLGIDHLTERHKVAGVPVQRGGAGMKPLAQGQRQSKRVKREDG